MHGAKQGENYKPECATAWSKVLIIIKLAYSGGLIPLTFLKGVLVLIPKGVPDQY
jgi:hypothetical protein